jgi:hypothetical protein
MKTSEFQKQMIDNINILIDQTNDLAALPMNELNWKENPGQWSVLECIEHLNRYNNYYLQEIESSFTQTNQRVDLELASTWIGRKSIAMMSPLNRKKQKTFKRMNPANSSLSSDVFKVFISDQLRMKAVLEDLMRIDINRKVVRVEFFKLLKMTIAEALEFLIVHQQRHMIQAFETNRKISGRPKVGALVV